ncbi:hypothetical protein LguiB_019263 [Lonicera macranthoides]
MEAISSSSSTFTGRKFLIEPSGRGSMRVARSINIRARREKRGQDNYGGKLVDENMIVLRMRIKDMKMLETRQAPPSDWMGWEKRYSRDYNEDVCEGVGFLQMFLLNTRPCLAIGILGLVASSVPISAWVIIFNVVSMVKGLAFPGFHLG